MLGWGKKDEHGQQTRLEHRGEHIRASRTGGIAARIQRKLGPINASLNTSRGLRLSTRIAKGARIGFQNGRAQFIGRWRSGPLAFNMSKTGVSASIKNQAGSFNVVKPRYSSFKFGGVQIRGKNAATAQLIFMSIMLVWQGFVATVQITLWLLWFLSLVIIFLKDIVAGIFVSEDRLSSADSVAADVVDANSNRREESE